MSAAVVVVVSLPIIVVIALLNAAAFVSARIHRRGPGPASTRRCRRWRGRVQKEDAIVLSGCDDRRGKIWRIAAVFAATGALALSGCASTVDTTEPTTQTATPTAQEEFVVEPAAEKTVTELPAGPLYWHVENFPALADAEAAAGPLSLATDVEGKAWLFTLGPEGTPMHGGSLVTEIGPLADVSAPEYLLRISHGVAAPGAKTEVHTHPGTEAFFVLEGQLSQKTPHGVNVVDAGKTLAGGAPEHPMEVTSSGGEELHELIMFVVDANKPFLSPATFE
jgi:quercetin dioxygenase-like cupin family protein